MDCISSLRWSGLFLTEQMRAQMSECLHTAGQVLLARQPGAVAASGRDLDLLGRHTHSRWTLRQEKHWFGLHSLVSHLTLRLQLQQLMDLKEPTGWHTSQAGASASSSHQQCWAWQSLSSTSSPVITSAGLLYTAALDLLCTTTAHNMLQTALQAPAQSH